MGVFLAWYYMPNGLMEILAHFINLAHGNKVEYKNWP